MIQREMAGKLKEMAGKFPVVTVTGPRQSGKTTLVRYVFADYTYVTLEQPDIRLRAESDPIGFLDSLKGNIIIDEIQNLPSLLSYIQVITDREGKKGHFILTGSQSLLLSEKVSQSLAGRTAVLKLLPLSYNELLQQPDISKFTLNNWLFTGFYPRIYDSNISPLDFYPAYTETYIQRDVRQIQNVRDLNLFIRFIKLCAGRVGQLLDYTSLANDTGTSVNTIKNWISVLEASYIILLVQPYFENLNKRQVKSPKLYFIDTGLLCNLLSISDSEMLDSHYLIGNIFENMVFLELFKRSLNKGMQPEIYFFRDNNKTEVDCIIHSGNTLELIEIKSSKTFHTDFTKKLELVKKQITGKNVKTSVIYNGDDQFTFQDTIVLNWKNINKLSSTDI
jgi:uncharacterized protein